GGDLRRGRFALDERAHCGVGLFAAQVLAEDEFRQCVSDAHAATSSRLCADFRKFCRSSLPCSVRIDSGWNWTPWTGYSRWRTAMITPESVRAVTSSESGTASGAAHSEW